MTSQNLLIECWVTGATPMMQNRATEEALRGETRMNTPSERPDPRDLCEAVLYRLPSKQIAVPGGAFARMLREAGGSHKSKGSRKSLKYIVPAAVLVMDDLCGLYLYDRKTAIHDFEVDARPVTIPATKGRIMRYRPRFNEWSCRVMLRINPNIMDEITVRRLMIEGLAQVGIGDFRPEKGGPFGVADLTSWTIVTQRPLTAAQRRNSAAA